MKYQTYYFFCISRNHFRSDYGSSYKSDDATSLLLNYKLLQHKKTPNFEKSNQVRHVTRQELRFRDELSKISWCTRYHNDNIISQILAKGFSRKKSHKERLPLIREALTHLEKYNILNPSFACKREDKLSWMSFFGLKIILDMCLKTVHFYAVLEKALTLKKWEDES